MTNGAKGTPDLSQPAPAQPAPLRAPPLGGHGPLHTEYDSHAAVKDVAATIAAQVQEGLETGVLPGVAPVVGAPDTAPGAPIDLGDNPPVGPVEGVPAAPADVPVDVVGDQPLVPVEGEPAPLEPVVPEEIDLSLVEALAEVGFELGIEPESVPVDLREAYNSILQSAVASAQRELDAVTEVESLRQERDALSRSFTEAPDKVLLTMAVTQPETFQKVMEVYNKMQEEPDYKAIVLRELDSEAKLQEVERRGNLLQYKEDMAEARLLTLDTQRTAARLGVDSTLAMEQVGAAIKANSGRPISRDLVEGIVARLVTGSSKVRKSLAPKTIQTPTQAVAAAAAPGALPAGVPVPATDTPPGGDSYTGLKKGRQSKIRGIVAAAASKFNLHDH